MSKQITQGTLAAMRAWLRALERACIAKNATAIIALYKVNSDTKAFFWELAPIEMQVDYESFTDRANNVVYS